MPTAASVSRHARSVAPVVTMSSKSTTRDPGGGNAAWRTRRAPARLAARSAASRPTESRVRRASASACATRMSGRCGGEGAGEPGHVVAAAGPRRRRAGRRGHEPRGAGPVGRHRVQHGEEVPGQRRGEVAAAALLVAEEGRAQRPGVAARGEHGRAAGQRDPRRGAEPLGAVRAPGPDGGRFGAPAAFGGQHEIDERDRKPPDVHPEHSAPAHPSPAASRANPPRAESDAPVVARRPPGVAGLAQPG